MECSSRKGALSTYDEPLRQFVNAESTLWAIANSDRIPQSAVRRILAAHQDAFRDYFRAYPFVLEGAFAGHELCLIALRSTERSFDAIPRALRGEQDALRQLMELFDERAASLLEDEALDRLTREEREEIASTDLCYAEALRVLVSGQSLPPPNAQISAAEQRVHALCEHLRSLMPR